MSFASAQAQVMERVRIRVRGSVQGVGFRPFVHGLADRFDVTGWVLNDGDGVLIEAEGLNTTPFLNALKHQAPPLARIDGVDVETVQALGGDTFVILKSEGGIVQTRIPADGAVCDACLEELFDPTDRHYRYPFINCTHCGPRYTITRSLPYDRPQTSMSAFAMCSECASEYIHVKNRRFHAQPIACPTCGPKLSMGVEEIVARLLTGEILGLKGLGGFHIVCDARNEMAVVELRKRKNREEKPLAVMVANVASAKRIVQMSEVEAQHLSITARPILVLPKQTEDTLATSIAPGLDSIGVMLPGTPMHYLLFHEAAGRPVGVDWLELPQDLALVMTSANPGGEPLVTANDEAYRRLDSIADAIVTHDRDILIRADDSVQRFIGGTPTFIRRARGFVPDPIKLPKAVSSGLAVGAHLKATVCVTRGDEAFVSQHIGDLEGPEALKFFEETVDHLLDITGITPAWVAHDLHPDFYSTRFADNFALTHNIPQISVQHHHAHVAAVAVEHGCDEPVLGLALDGFGLGEGDGISHNWGGEALIVDGCEYRRVGHLAPLPMPGGEAAFRAPWRMAAAVLHQHGRQDEISARFSKLGDTDLLLQMLNKGVNIQPSSSCGRLFDAAAGLLGVQSVASFDGQAPMKLEALVTKPVFVPGTWKLDNGVLDVSALLQHISDMDAISGANAFHGTLINAIAEWAQVLAQNAGLNRIVLSGGCVLNRVLTQGLERLLQSAGFEVLKPRLMPPTDGAISLGQAYVAALSAQRTN